MPATATATPVREAVTVPGTAELEFTASGFGRQKVDVVVLYTVMDNAGVRITQGASHLRTLGPKSAVVRQVVGFDGTDKPTPGAFRVKATVMEDGREMASCTWNLQVRSSAAAQVMQAMETLPLDAPYTPLPSDEELRALAAQAGTRPSRKKVATKKKAPAKKKAAARKKAPAKKKAAAKKKAPARKVATKKKTTAKKTTAKRGAGAKRSAAKKKAPARKKAATKKRTARR